MGAPGGRAAVRLRNYIPADADRLAAVYRDAVLKLGQSAYSAEQTRVWALYPEDLEQFRRDLSAGLTVCALADDAPVAFGQIHPADHIAYMYCQGAHARRGYCSAILRSLEAYARSQRVAELRVEASCVARPFFARYGYQVVAEERSIRHGIAFQRYRMQKIL